MSDSARNTNKTSLIIEAAQKLFGQFGIDKVSMHEIADELHISKASLYYYFPDKESLYKAVLEKEQSEFLMRIRERTEQVTPPDKMLIEYVSMRLEYFSRLLNLSRIRMEDYAYMKPVLRETTMIFREKEMEMVKEIIRRGMETKLFFVEDPDKTVSLFLDLLKGLRSSVITDRRTLAIDKGEFEHLYERTRLFTEIFIRGLKAA